MSAQIETRLARMALKLPKLKPLQAQKLEIILDRMYRVHLSRKLKQRGGTRPTTDEEIAELERQKAADDEVWAELEAELEKDVAAQEAAEAIDAEPLSEEEAEEEETEDEAEEEEETEDETEAEDESAFENIMEKFEKLEITQPCSECDNCIPVKFPGLWLIRTSAQVKEYWEKLEKARDKCSECLYCLKTCRSPECPSRAEKSAITQKINMDFQSISETEMEAIRKGVKAVKQDIKKIKPCPECAACVSIEGPPPRALLIMTEPEIQKYLQDLIKYKDLLLLTQNKCNICSQCCQPQECPNIETTSLYNRVKLGKATALIAQVKQQRLKLKKRQMLAGRRRK